MRSLRGETGETAQTSTRRYLRPVAWACGVAVCVGLVLGCGSASVPGGGGTSASPLPTSSDTTVRAPLPNTPPQRTVLSPYDNRYFVVDRAHRASVDATLADGFTPPSFPSEVPAYVVTRRPLPTNDLTWSTWGPKGPLYSVPWDEVDPAESTEQAKTLGDQTKAAATAEAFLRDHGLLASDLLPPTVEVGSSFSMSGGGSTSGPTITSWLVSYAQPSPDGGGEVQNAGLSVRVAGVGVVGVGWTLRDFRADGVVPLRPFAEVIADQDAWTAGSTSRGLAVGDTAIRLTITGARLEWTLIPNPATDDQAGHYLIPLYIVDVTVTNPSAPPAAKGQWYLPAAATVESVVPTTSGGVR
jgi:hypothetical protein